MWCVDNGFPITTPAQTDALGNDCHLADRGCIIQELAVIDCNIKRNAPHVLTGIRAALSVGDDLTGSSSSLGI